MSSYYPIPTKCSVTINGKEVDILPSVSFVNITTNKKISRNHLTLCDKLEQGKDLWLHVYALNSEKWFLVDCTRCKYGESRMFSRLEFSDYPDCPLVVVPLLYKNHEASLIKLPQPANLKLDKTPVEPRATYLFSFGSSSSSYQGEFPYAMSIIKGSMLSFDYLANPSSQSKASLLLLMNIKESAGSQLKHRINVVDSYSRKIVERFDAYENHCTWHKISKEDNSAVHAFICNSCSFIPVYINCQYHEWQQEINVEHTHPPSEYFWINDDMRMTSKLKSKWLKIQ